MRKEELGDKMHVYILGSAEFRGRGGGETEASLLIDRGERVLWGVLLKGAYGGNRLSPPLDTTDVITR